MKAALRTVLGTTGSVVAFVRPLQAMWFPGNPANRLQRAVAEVDAVILDQLHRRRRAPADDVLSFLIRVDEEGPILTDREIRDQVVSLIAAANDTTASALAWCLTWVHRTPHVRRRLLAELDGVDPEDPALQELPYLDATVNESLRLTSVVELMSRAVVGPVTIAGFELPLGVLLSACSYLSHRNPAVFEDPTTFEPERFVGRTYSSHDFYPFGGGIRRCIGERMAIREMKVVLAVALQTCTFTPVGPPSRAGRRNVTIAPSSRTPMVVGRR